MRNHVAVHCNVLPHLKPLCIGQSFAIEFPGDLRSRISAGHAFQEHARPRLQSLLGEGLANLRGFDCGCKNHLQSKPSLDECVNYVLATDTNTVVNYSLLITDVRSSVYKIHVHRVSNRNTYICQILNI